MFHLEENKYYQQWLKRWLGKGFNLRPACGEDTGKDIILRHDIDRIEPTLIMGMALIEQMLGLRGSYYIIIDEKYGYYDKYKDFFKELQNMGHEVGLHVTAVEATHSPKWKGRNVRRSIVQLKKDIERIQGDGFNLKTVSAHGAKLNYTNKDLLMNLGAPYNIEFPFKDDKCILTDSKRILSIKKNLFHLDEGTYYIVAHPENFTPHLETKATWVRYINDMDKNLLKKLV